MRRSKKNRTVRNLFIMSLAVILVICADVFFVTIGKIHLASHTDLSAYAENANTVTETTKALRGSILDNAGQPIAQDNRSYDILCILDSSRKTGDGKPAYVKDKEATAQALSPILGMDYDKIMGYLTQKDIYQTELGSEGRQLSETVKAQIDDLNLPGIEFRESIKRYYPNGKFASNLIGYAQADEDGSETGKMGFEQILNDYLVGTDGSRTYQANKDGYVLPGMKELVTSEKNGDNVYLTLDSDIQNQLETSIAQSMAQSDQIYGAWGAVVEVKTGKVLAWAQSDEFDPNVLDITNYQNLGAQSPYEPGSTLKPFTWAAAINEGKYNGSATTDGNAYCYGADENNNPIRSSTSDACVYNANELKYGTVTLDEGLEMSLNTVAAAIQNEWITPDINLEYLKKFGFFSDVDTDGLPESSGTLSFTWPIDKLSLSFGQGSTVTMLQLMQAYTAIFSDGTMVKPYFIESIRDAYDNNKVIYQADTTVKGNPITADTAKHMQQLMYEVVNGDKGTMRRYQIPECKLIGKSGTAQISQNGHYLEDRYINSGILAMPADNPQIMVYYAVDGNYNTVPLDTRYTPQVSLLREIAIKYGFNNDDNSTDTTEQDTSDIKSQEAVTVSSMPGLINHSLDYADNALSPLGTENIIIGNGTSIIDQYPKEGEQITSGQRVFLLTDTTSFTMPDMTGWTRKDVSALWAVTGLEFKIEGDGKVTSQSIPAGSTVAQGSEIDVVLQ